MQDDTRPAALRPTLRLLIGIALFAGVYTAGLMGVTAVARAAGWGRSHAWLIRTGFLNQITFLVLSLALMAVLGRGRLARFGFRLTAPRNIMRCVGVAAIAMLILMSPMIVSSVLGHGASASGPASGPTRSGMRTPSPAAGHLWQTILFVWLIASTCEEVFYRGLLQGWLEPLATVRLGRGRVALSLPVVACAVAFGLGHLCLRGMVPPPMLVSIIVATTVTGLIAGYYRERTGSLLPAIAAHMTGNVVGTLLPLALGAIKRMGGA